MSVQPSDDTSYVIVIRDRQAIRLATQLDGDTATTVIAVVSEDPASWNEFVAYWPRYATPVVAEFADALPFQTVDRESAIQAMATHVNWYLIDMVQKRLCFGSEAEVMKRDGLFAFQTDESADQQYLLPFHLPPWWEHLTDMQPTALDEPRETPLIMPQTNRTVLYGREMICDIAKRVTDAIQQTDWSFHDLDLDSAEDCRTLYRKTVEVHRDWLMTPRSDLQGKCPRNQLHGARGWSDKIVDGQQSRFHGINSIIAIPTDVEGFETMPMGNDEVILYFDLCRVLIAEGWLWCHHHSSSSNDVEKLAKHLEGVRDEWMNEPYEGGTTPRFIIECSRRRIPRGTEVPIQGMDEVEPKQHLGDCDCPICAMMEEGVFGVAFASLSGEQLERDDEFAFSMCETYEDWEFDRNSWDDDVGLSDDDSELEAPYDDDDSEQDDSDEEIPWDSEDEDEFRSAWSNPMLDNLMPTGRFGQMKLAFRLSEIISDLEQASSDHDLIKNLNQSFIQFVRSDEMERSETKLEFQLLLDQAGELYPDLVSKVADLQSQIDEFERTLASDGNTM